MGSAQQVTDTPARLSPVGSRVVKRAYRYRFYPTPAQAEQLARTFGCVRYVYNRALAERSRAWTQEQRRVTHAETDKMLTAWKRDPETAWLAEPSKGPLQATLRHLQAAFVNFWSKRASYPTFKKKGKTTDSATYFRNCFSYRDGQITLAKQDQPLRIVWSRPLPAGVVPSQVTVSRNARGQYYVSILVEETITEHEPTEAAVGIDAGSPRWSPSPPGRRSPTPSTSAETEPGSHSPSAASPASNPIRRTGRRPAARWPAFTGGLPTGAATICTSCLRGSSARTKRWSSRTCRSATWCETAAWPGRSPTRAGPSCGGCWSTRPAGTAAP
jgi:Helix-turn-helix domain